MKRKENPEKNAHLATLSTLLFMAYRLYSPINLEQLIRFYLFSPSSCCSTDPTSICMGVGWFPINVCP